MGGQGLMRRQAQDIACAGGELAAGLIAERFPVCAAVGMIHPPGDDAERDVRVFCEPFELCESVAGYARGSVTGIQVVEQSNAQRGSLRRDAWCV